MATGICQFSGETVCFTLTKWACMKFRWEKYSTSPRKGIEGLGMAKEANSVYACAGFIQTRLLQDDLNAWLMKPCFVSATAASRLVKCLQAAKNRARAGCFALFRQVACGKVWRQLSLRCKMCLFVVWKDRALEEISAFLQYEHCGYVAVSRNSSTLHKTNMEPNMLTSCTGISSRVHVLVPW